jgi:hypothetical protein
MARHFKQGRYTPRNPHKYIGKSLADGSPDIFYRSSWEHKTMVLLDLNESVIHWNSEDIVIPYLYPIDNRIHRYFVDLIATIRQADGSTKTILIEIKPKAETLPPKEPKRKTEKSLASYRKAVETFIKNQAKWEAAREYCKKNGIDFVILTEEHIFGKK